MEEGETHHQVCYCAGRAECHLCGQPFSEYGESLTEEEESQCEEKFCPVYDQTLDE